MSSNRAGVLSRLRNKTTAETLSFEGEHLDLDIHPTFVQRYLGPDFSREFLHCLAWIGGLSFFLFIVFSESLGLKSVLQKAFVSVFWQVWGAAGFFSIMRVKRMSTSNVLVGREGLRVVVTENKTVVPRYFHWTDVKDVVRIAGSDGGIMQLNIVLKKDKTITIYDTSDIYRLLEFLKRNVRFHIAGVEHHYVYSLLPVIAFAAAAGFCLIGVYFEDDLVRLTVDFLDRFLFGK